jgi:hypothetical protein
MFQGSKINLKMINNEVLPRTSSKNKACGRPIIRPNQIAMYLMQGKLLKAALLRSWELRN